MKNQEEQQQREDYQKEEELHTQNVEQIHQFDVQKEDCSASKQQSSITMNLQPTNQDNTMIVNIQDFPAHQQSTQHKGLLEVQRHPTKHIHSNILPASQRRSTLKKTGPFQEQSSQQRQVRDSQNEHLRDRIATLELQRSMIEKDFQNKFRQVKDLQTSLLEKQQRLKTHQKQLENKDKTQRIKQSQELTSQYLSNAQLIMVVTFDTLYQKGNDQNYLKLKKDLEKAVNDLQKAKIFTKYLEFTLETIFKELKAKEKTKIQSLQSDFTSLKETQAKVIKEQKELAESYYNELVSEKIELQQTIQRLNVQKSANNIAIQQLRTNLSSLGAQLQRKQAQFKYEQDQLNNTLMRQEKTIQSLTAQKTEAKSLLQEKGRQNGDLHKQLQELLTENKKTIDRLQFLQQKISTQEQTFNQRYQQKYRIKLQQKENELDDKMYKKLSIKDLEIKGLKEGILKIQKQKDNLKEEIKQKDSHVQFQKVNLKEKQQLNDLQKSLFHKKTAQTLTQLLHHSQSSLQDQQKTISNHYALMEAKKANQAMKIDLLTNALELISQQLNSKEEALTIQTVTLANTQSILTQTQMNAQQYQQEIKALKSFIQRQQNEARKTNENLVNALNLKLKESLQESSKFYKAFIESKEEYYNNKLSTLQSELEILNTINQYKDKAHHQNIKNHQNTISALRVALKQAQSNLQRSVRNTQEEIGQAKWQNEMLTKRLQIYQQAVKANKQTIARVLSQKNSISETLSKLHCQLQDKQLQQILTQIDKSQQSFYNPEVIDFLHCIYYKHNEETIKLIKSTNTIKSLQSLIQELKLRVRNAQRDRQSKEKFLNKQKQSKEQAQTKVKLQEQEKKKLDDQYKRKIQQLQRIKSSLQQDKLQQQKLNAKIGTLHTLNEYSKKQIEKLRKSLIAAQQMNQKQATDMEKQIERYKQKEKQKEKDLQKVGSQLNNARTTIEKLIFQHSSLEESVSTLKKQLQLKQQQSKRIRQQDNRSEREETNRNLLQLQSFKNEARKLQGRVKQLQKNQSKLKERIKQLESKPIQYPQFLNKKSWDEKEESLLQGYQDMIQSLKEEKELLQSEISSLKAKIKRIQAQNVRRITSYISPAKSPIKNQRDFVSPKKSEIRMEQRQQQQVILKVQEKKPKSLLFRSICMLENEDQGRSFLTKKIQQLYSSKKIVQTLLSYKYSELNKVFSFSTLLPKNELQNECFVFLFGSKTNKFGLVSYKKDNVSKQSALIVSITNKKVVSKRPNADSLLSFAITVDAYGNLTVGGNHWTMKPSTRNLIVKDTLNKYFEPYEKKEVFGPQHWREELNIELTEFEIHRIVLK